MKCKRCNHNEALESNGVHCFYCNNFVKKKASSITGTEWWASIDQEETDRIYLDSPNKVPCRFLSKSASSPTQVRIKYDNGAFRDVCPNSISHKENWKNIYSYPPKYGLVTLQDVTDLLLVDMNIKNFGYSGYNLATGSNSYIWHKCEKCGKPKISIAHHFVNTTKQCEECASLQRVEAVTITKINNRANKIFNIANTIMIENLGSGKGMFQCKKCETVYSSRSGNVLNSFDRFGTNCCPKCYQENVGVSQVELDFIGFIKSFYHGNIITQYKIDAYFADIYIPEKNLIIEVDGIYWHSEANIDGDRYKSFKKKNLYDDLGYKSLFIRDYEILAKNSVVKEKVKYILLGNEDKKVRASKLVIKDISWRDADIFLNKNHFMGAGERCELRFGLFDGNEMVAVATFKGERIGNVRTEELKTLELVRFAASRKIIGGLSKVIKNLINRYPELEHIVTYADRRFSQKDFNLYTNNNFKLQSDIPRPSYLWFKGTSFLKRFQTQKHHLRNLFPEVYSDELSESNILWLAGYHRIHDCGHYKYVYSV